MVKKKKENDSAADLFFIYVVFSFLFLIKFSYFPWPFIPCKKVNTETLTNDLMTILTDRSRFCRLKIIFKNKKKNRKCLQKIQFLPPYLK